MSDLVLWLRNGVYQVRGTVKIPGRKEGVRVRASTGTARLKDAEAFRDRLRIETMEQATLGPAYNLTFSDCALIYLEKGGERRFMKPIHDRFGPMRVKDIDAGLVSAFATDRYGHMAPQSVKRYFYTPFNAALRKGCEAHKIPVVKFEAPKPGERKAVEPAPAEWFPQFFRAAFFRLATAVLLMTTTGARVSEMCNVYPGDCSLDREQPRLLLRRTKNGRPREVVLTPVLAEAIRALIEQDNLGPEDRVFGYSQRWSFNQAIERVCKKAGIKYYSSHQLGRHAFSARILAQGGTLKEVQDAGGWLTFRIVDEIYGHLEHKAVERKVLDTGSQVDDLLAGTQLTHANHQQARRPKRRSMQTPNNARVPLVGTIGFEPMTPTMSRGASNGRDPPETPENKGNDGENGCHNAPEHASNMQETKRDA